MKDYIPENSVIQSSSLSDDTKIYQFSRPRVRIFELNVLREIALILNFRRSSRDFAEEIIRRHNGEDISFSITDAEFAEKMWPSLSESARYRKIVRAKKNLKEDQQLSNWRFVFIPPRKIITQNGQYRCEPTIYKPGQYWEVSDTLQFQTQKVDLFAMKTSQANKEKRRLLELILADFGAKRIERVKAEKEKKEKSDSPLCKCDCASCAHCASKSATASEAEKARPAQIRVTKESVERELHALNDAIFECGQRWMNLGLRLDEFNGKIHRDYIYLIQRLAAAVKRANAPGLKLMGGQPK